MKTPERWQRVEELFAWGIGRDRAVRAHELAARCAGDDDLRVEVAELIDAWETSADFLETPAVEQLASVVDRADPRIGVRIGRYRIVRLLGHGGMGVVYEAIQENPRREVALKVIRGGALADPLRIRRFKREAESLARLDHEGIARILEAGLDEASGDHWFAMELVRGVPLAEHVRTRRPDRAALLALFVRICSAVDHAHRQGIVHRDLKPSNLFVVASSPGRAGEEAHPAIKVLDFGLARCVQTDGADVTLVTEPGRVFGTLPYMSPEQARGVPGAIGPASDVYSLGVILYELLTGRLPLDVDGVLLPEAVRRIAETTPERPSRFDRALRGDLETIVAKALDKEPARRYASAAELARDVERHLGGEPIAAQPPTVAYQARKLVRRHKLVFGAAVLLFVLGTASSIVTSILYTQARAAERRARVEADTASEIARFLQDMLASAEPGRRAPHELSVREVLDSAAQRLESDLGGRPEVAAALHATIGDAYRGLALFDRAEEHLEAAIAFQRAQPASAEPLAIALAGLGRIRLDQGRYAESEPLEREAVAILRRTGPPKMLAEVLMQLGSVVRLRANSVAALGEARSLYEEALAIAEDLPLPDPNLTANLLNEYAGALAALGDNAGAEQHYRRALELHRACFGDLDLRIAQGENDLAIVLARGERQAEAIEISRRALASFERILGRAHPTTIRVRMTLGSLLVRGAGRAELEAGEALLVEVLADGRTILGENHPDVTRALNQLSYAARRRKDLTRAREYASAALATNRAQLGEFHLEVGNGEASLALIALDAGDTSGALPHARRAVEVYRRVLPASHTSVLQSEGLLGSILTTLGEHAEAEGLLTASLAMLEAQRGPDDPLTLYAVEQLAALRRASGATAEAESLEARVAAARAPSAKR